MSGMYVITFDLLLSWNLSAVAVQDPRDVPVVDGALQLHHPTLHVRLLGDAEVLGQPPVPVGSRAVRR